MGGATISFLNMVKGLHDRGYEIVVIIRKADPVFLQNINNIGIRCIYSRIAFSAYKKQQNRLSELVNLLKLWVIKIYSFICLYKVILKEKPDIVHSNTGVLHEPFWVSKVCKIPHVWHLREYQDKDFHMTIVPSKSFFSKCLKHSYVISITKGIHNHFGLEECKQHRVIYNGVLPISSAVTQPIKEKFFLCSSRVSHEKGHEDVIRSFAVFYETHKDYKLIILGFGDDNYISHLKKICKEQHCEDAVVFEGYKQCVTSYMQKCKALIVASYYEGFGRMTAEAAFCGCLVIGRNTGGTKEILERIDGLSFLSRDELTSRMEETANMSKERYLSMVSKSQKTALDLYSNENNINSIDKFYCDILANKVK